MAEAKQHRQERTVDQVPALRDAMSLPTERKRCRQRREQPPSNPSSSSVSTSSSEGDACFTLKTPCPHNTNSPDGHRNTGSRRRRRRRRPKKNHKNSNEQQHPPLTEQEQSKYVALDCEMVGAGLYGETSMLARVCLIDWNSNVIYDTYVTPTETVTDYRTFVSGITPELLEGAVDIWTCRDVVASLLKGKILVGHALKNDLHVLHLNHPWQNIRDTGKYEPFMTTLGGGDRLWPRKLKELAHEKLGGRIIQDPSKGAHNPFEDARAAFDLYKLVRNKWEKVMDYKIQKTNEIITLMGEQETKQLELKGTNKQDEAVASPQ
mmetsp:Transcript_21317/g.32838  ORF Transcript_21317/g.32838 Transcript_21317/m.32838 type:complete len:321 (+) Transcript_21317:100-1062(+)